MKWQCELTFHTVAEMERQPQLLSIAKAFHRLMSRPGYWLLATNISGDVGAIVDQTCIKGTHSVQRALD